MAYKIIVDPNARVDIVESNDWFNNVLQGLGFKLF